MTEPAKPLRSPSEFFERAITDGGSIVMDCGWCGRTHFEDSERAGDWSDGELDRLRENVKEKPDKYVACEYSVMGGHVEGKMFVIGCPCNSVRPYENFIWNHRGIIAKYLHSRTLAERDAANIAQVLIGEPLKEAFNL